jgi:hypothetical protein
MRRESAQPPWPASLAALVVAWALLVLAIHLGAWSVFFSLPFVLDAQCFDGDEPACAAGYRVWSGVSCLVGAASVALAARACREAFRCAEGRSSWQRFGVALVSAGAAVLLAGAMLFA